MSRISIKKLLSHSTEKHQKGGPSVIHKISGIKVSKNLRDKRGGRYRGFLSNMFCLTAPNQFVEDPSVYR